MQRWTTQLLALITCAGAHGIAQGEYIPDLEIEHYACVSPGTSPEVAAMSGPTLAMFYPLAVAAQITDEFRITYVQELPHPVGRDGDHQSFVWQTCTVQTAEWRALESEDERNMWSYSDRLFFDLDPEATAVVPIAIAAIMLSCELRRRSSAY